MRFTRLLFNLCAEEWFSMRLRSTRTINEQIHLIESHFVLWDILFRLFLLFNTNAFTCD